MRPDNSLIEPTGWYRWDRRRDRQRRLRRLAFRFLLPLYVALWASVITIPSARAMVNL